MRNRIWIACSVALAACLVLLLFKAKQRQEIVSREQSEAPTNGPFVRNRRQQAGGTQTAEKTSALNAPGVKTESFPRSGVERSNAIYEEIMADWQRPIEFYGKVLGREHQSCCIGTYCVPVVWLLR